MIQKACQIAKSAREEAYEEGRTTPIFLAADIGPIPQQGDCSEEELLLQYQQICDVFLEEGMTIFWFETFSDTFLLDKVIDYIKQNCKEAWITISFCLNKNGYTLLGKRADKLLTEWDNITSVDAIGFNCGIGSGHMKKIVQAVTLPKQKYMFIAPNAGYPEQVSNRMNFSNNIEYFSDNLYELYEAGVQILGTCCGTTPAYTKRIAEKISTGKKRENAYFLQATEKQEIIIENKKECLLEIHESKKVEENSSFIEKQAVLSFAEKLKQGKKVIAVELDPPFDANIEKIMDCANRLKECDIDILTFADSPMGRSRIDSVLMSAKIKKELGVEVMPHICCRDKNMIAMHSMFLGAYIHDIRNLLLVTGDPIPAERRKTVTSVFDYNSIRLMRYVRELNEEHFSNDPFCYGGALNYAGVNVEAIIKRMQDKQEAGVSYFMTQPIFAEEDKERVAYLKQRTGAKILCGIMPLVSYKNAMFVKNEIAGIQVPDSIIERYDSRMSKEEAEWVGVDLAKELMETMTDFSDGYYFMLPFNRVSILEKLYLSKSSQSTTEEM